MAEVYSVPRKTAGLNNLKMAIFGVQKIAQNAGGSYRLPDQLFDFTPTPDSIGDNFLPLESVFDAASVNAHFEDATSASETARTSNADCLDIVKRIMIAELGQVDAIHGETARAFASFMPAKVLREEVARIRSLLPDQVCGLQLRIERDWQEYTVRKGWKAGTIDAGGEIVLDHNRIFQKMAATEGLPITIFACCDEDDLTVSRKQIRADAKAFGFDLVFKSDLGSPIVSRLMRSVIDFDLCLGLPAYVGLPRSTFSNILCMVDAHQMGKQPQHYVFDAASERCERRYDMGRATNAAAATRK